MLVRRTPLPSKFDLTSVFGTVPPAPLRDPRELAVLGFQRGQAIAAIERGVHRGLAKESKQIDEPLLQLMERLRPHFEVVRAVRFAYQGK